MQPCKIMQKATILKDKTPARGLLIAWAPIPTIAGSAVIAPASAAYGLIFGGLLGGSSDATQQFLTMKPGESYSYTDTLIAIGTGSLTQGKGVIFTTIVNVTIDEVIEVLASVEPSIEIID